MIEALEQNACDFALVSVLPEGLAVETLELMENELFLVGSNESSDNIEKPKDLEKVTLLFREEGSATRNAMQTYLSNMKIQAKKSMELVSNEAVKQAVNAGLGYSIVPLIGSKTYLANENIKIYPLPGLPIITKWNLIYNKGKQLTPAQTQLLNHIYEHKDSIIDQYFSQ